MSKSLGNFMTVLDILKEYEPEVVRYFILNTHYRSPLDFSDERLEEAKRSLERLRTAQNNLKEIEAQINAGPDAESLALGQKVAEIRQGFMDAMNDDFNTSLAISYQFALAKEINVYHNAILAGTKKPDGKLVDQIHKVWREMADIIGILEDVPAAGQAAPSLTKKLPLLPRLRKDKLPGKPGISPKPMPSVTNWLPRESFWKIRPKACGGRESEI